MATSTHRLDPHLSDPLAGPIRTAFTALDDSQIPYVILRGFDPVDELGTSADIDVFIPAYAIPSARPVLEQSGWRFRKAQTGRLPHLFFDNWESDTALVRSIDVVTALHYGHEAHHLCCEGEVLATAVTAHGLRVPQAWMTAFCFSLHVVLDKGWCSPANLLRAHAMQARCQADPDGVSVLHAHAGSEAVEFLRAFFDLLDAQDPVLPQSLVRRAKSLPVLSPRPLSAGLSRWRARWRQLRRPVPRIAVLGIDGSGKSTIVRTTAERGGTLSVHHGYLGNNAYRTWPARWLSSAIDSRREAGQRSGLALRVLVNLDTLWRPLELAARMAIAEHRAELVLYDRFPMGQDDGAPTTPWGRLVQTYVHMMRRLLPSPDLLILLDGDDRTIWARKQEMPFEMHVHMQARYRAFTASVSWDAAVVRTDRSLEETLKEMQRRIRQSSQVQRKLYGS